MTERATEHLGWYEPPNSWRMEVGVQDPAVVRRLATHLRAAKGPQTIDSWVELLRRTIGQARCLVHRMNAFDSWKPSVLDPWHLAEAVSLGFTQRGVFTRAWTWHDMDALEYVTGATLWDLRWRRRTQSTGPVLFECHLPALDAWEAGTLLALSDDE